MKKPIKIEWESMTGMGPAAWDSDHKVLTIHTPHHETDYLLELTRDKKKDIKEAVVPSSNEQTEKLQP